MCGVVVTEENDEEDEEEDEIKDKTQPKWRIWLNIESWREANHWLPWRPDTAKGRAEEECEDPDRQVQLHQSLPIICCVLPD